MENKMKEFNLERALAGDPVITRGERGATQIHKFDVGIDGIDTSKYCVVAVVNGKLLTFNSSGGYYDDGQQDDNDLFMGTVKKTGWINIYNNGMWNSNKIHDSKADALSFAESQTMSVLIDTIMIEWEQ